MKRRLPFQAGKTIPVLVLFLSFALPRTIAAYPYSDKPHLFFLEGSIGSTYTAALERENDILNEQGIFYWQSGGNLYRYVPNDLTYTAGIGYEYTALPWLGLRALYSYSGYLHFLSARRGSGRYGYTSTMGGQMAETHGYFVGPIFRFKPFNQNSFAIEIPLQWGIHTGEYYPLRVYSELREQGFHVPGRPEEHTVQALKLQKWRYGLGVAFFRPNHPFYASLSFLVEHSFTQTDIGPEPVMPAGSGWNSFLLLLSVGWRLDFL